MRNPQERKTQTRHKRRAGFLCLLAAQNTPIAALKGVLELVCMGAANSERAAPTCGDHACTPRVDVRLHMHLMEQGVGPRSPLAAFLSAIETLCDEEHFRREGEELCRAREGEQRWGRPGPRAGARLAAGGMGHVKDATGELVCGEGEEFVWGRMGKARCVHGGDCGEGRALGRAVRGRG